MKYEIVCPIYGCGHNIEVPKRVFDNPHLAYCDVCCTPLGPVELGLTGNGREDILEFIKENPNYIDD